MKTAPAGASLLVLVSGLLAGLAEASDTGLQAAMFAVAWVLLGAATALLCAWIGAELTHHYRTRKKEPTDDDSA